MSIKNAKLGMGEDMRLRMNMEVKGSKVQLRIPKLQLIICDFKLLNMYLFLIKYMYCPWKSREKG